MSQESVGAWPVTRYDDWSETCATLHLWAQIVGKIRLATTPWLNHGWHVPFYVTSRGLTTSPMPYGARTFEMQFDFVGQFLECTVDDGSGSRLDLRPQSVRDFRKAVFGMLDELGISVSIRDLPCEIAGAIPFSEDTTHAAYDADAAQRFWRALVQVDRVFKLFRTGFIGKCSPVHFFWGSFDLAVTRFSGRKAPLHPGVAPGVAPAIMQEAYSHELSSAGFWPGGGGADASFYSYAYPEPDGFRSASVRPPNAGYNSQMGEFLLPYESVRTAADPDEALLGFLQGTYEAAATAANWDRDVLECPLGRPGTCRALA